MNVWNIHKPSLFLFKSFMTEDVQGLVNKLAWFIYPIYQFEFKKNCFAWITSPVSGIFKNIYSWIKLSRTFFSLLTPSWLVRPLPYLLFYQSIFKHRMYYKTTNHQPQTHRLVVHRTTKHFTTDPLATNLPTGPPRAHRPQTILSGSNQWERISLRGQYKFKNQRFAEPRFHVINT